MRAAYILVYGTNDRCAEGVARFPGVYMVTQFSRLLKYVGPAFWPDSCASDAIDRFIPRCAASRVGDRVGLVGGGILDLASYAFDLTRSIH